MQGTITKIISNLYTITVDDKSYDCYPRGKFIYQRKNLAVGDHVLFDQNNKYILDILPRNNYLKRPSIANVDLGIIVISVKEPKLSLNLLDKMISSIIIEKIKPIIVFTKIDLLQETELDNILNIIKYYNKIGIKAITNNELAKLSKIISGKIVVLCGQSGVGKSSLVNKLLPDLNLKTAKISKALGRGVHTTRHVELFKYQGALIADTPGFGALDISNLSALEIAHTFPEFNLNCQYSDCIHLNEINCEVKKQVESGKIMASRYENYVKFVRSK